MFQNPGLIRLHAVGLLLQALVMLHRPLGGYPQWQSLWEGRPRPHPHPPHPKSPSCRPMPEGPYRVSWVGGVLNGSMRQFLYSAKVFFVDFSAFACCIYLFFQCWHELVVVSGSNTLPSLLQTFISWPFFLWPKQINILTSIFQCIKNIAQLFVAVDTTV